MKPPQKDILHIIHCINRHMCTTSCINIQISITVYARRTITLRSLAPSPSIDNYQAKLQNAEGPLRCALLHKNTNQKFFSRLRDHHQQGWYVSAAKCCCTVNLNISIPSALARRYAFRLQIEYSLSYIVRKLGIRASHMCDTHCT